MADDLLASFGKGFGAFAHSRAGDLVGDSFSDTGSLIESLFDGTTGTTKAAFQQLKTDVENLVDAVKPLVEALKPDIAEGKAAVQEMAAELGKDPFGADEVARILTALAKLLVAYDRAITKCAEKLAEGEPPGPDREARVKAIKDDINGMNAPIKKALKGVGGDVTGGFDRLCDFVLGIDDASEGLGDRLSWSYAEKKLSVEIVAPGPAGAGPLQFDGAKLLGFFQYKDDFKAGIEIKTKLKAGLRSDKLLEKIMPGQPATADAEGVAITIDTKDGLTFGAGKDKRLVLPVRFSYPGLELRELAVEQPAADNVEGRNRVNVTATIAGKLGEAFAIVVEGGGVTVRWVDGADPEVLPKIPTGAGMRIKTGLVNGGGFLRYVEARNEYGGVFQLEVAKIGVTAIGLIAFRRDTDPPEVPDMSFVIVMGIRFAPKIELGYGFTLNGLGGILAIERTLDSLALANGLKTDVVGQLLFPSDPVAAAPQILDQLGKIFPPQRGGFVIGPIAELGWGSQAGFLKARLGIVLSLPDPKIVLLGAVEIGVPSTELDPKLRIVDIRANLMGEVSADYFFLKVTLTGSKLFQIGLSGDIAIYVQWSGEGAFALSVGGFFPGYEYPKQLGTMDRAGLKFAPPVPWLSISALAYFAVTANSIQFGGRVELVAKVGPAKAEAWIQIDALFQWAPHFHFIILLDVGIKVTAFGTTVAGVRFTGELRGDKPFYLKGNATVEILWWDVDVPIGPIEWGEKTPPPAPLIDPVSVAATALKAREAVTALLPADANQLVGFAETDEDLFHPLGRLEIKELSVPLETDLDRIGSSKVTARRINLRNATLGGQPAGAVWPVVERFSPGHFLNLTEDQVLARPEFEEHQAGIGLAATAGAAFPDAVHAAYAWNTITPGESFGAPDLQIWAFTKIAGKALGANAVSQMRRERDNPYRVPPKSPEPSFLRERGVVTVVARDTGQAAASGLAAMAPSDAHAFVAGAGLASRDLTTLVPMGAL